MALSSPPPLAPPPPTPDPSSGPPPRLLGLPRSTAPNSSFSVPLPPHPRFLFLQLQATGSSASSSQISPPLAPSLPSASSDAPAGVVEYFPIAPEGEGDSQTPVSSDAAAGMVEASAEPTDTSPEDLDNIHEVKRVLELLQKNRDMTFGYHKRPLGVAR